MANIDHYPFPDSVAGSGSALNADVILVDARPFRYASLHIYGTFVGTVSVQVSNEAVASDWRTVIVQNTASPASTALSAIVGPGVYVLPLNYRHLRVRITAYTSGTVLGAASLHPGYVPSMAVAGAVGVSGPVVLGASTSITGATRLSSDSTHGAPNFHHRLSTADTNLVSVKTTAANLSSLTLSNASGTTAAFFKLYNKASAPVSATDTPLLTIRIPANSTVTPDFGAFGLRLATGVAFAITGLAANADVTAVAANDVIVAMAYT